MAANIRKNGELCVPLQMKNVIMENFDEILCKDSNNSAIHAKFATILF